MKEIKKNIFEKLLSFIYLKKNIQGFVKKFYLLNFKKTSMGDLGENTIRTFRINYSFNDGIKDSIVLSGTINEIKKQAKIQMEARGVSENICWSEEI